VFERPKNLGFVLPHSLWSIEKIGDLWVKCDIPNLYNIED